MRSFFLVNGYQRNNNDVHLAQGGSNYDTSMGNVNFHLLTGLESGDRNYSKHLTLALTPSYEMLRWQIFAVFSQLVSLFSAQLWATS